VAVATDVQHQLELYGGRGRWTVEVEGGSVTITDALDNETDRHVATDRLLTTRPERS
jgi:hypothetical protein